MSLLIERVNLLATRIGNYVRDSVLPRLVPSGGTSGQVLQKTSATDYALGWISPSTSGTITSLAAALSANVSLTTTATWYDGPSVSLVAGTWLVIGRITHVRSATTAETIYARLGDGTNHYASTQFYHASVTGTGVVLPLNAVITLAATTTIKLQATSSAGASTSTMLAATTANGSGNNATNIIAIRLA